MSGAQVTVENLSWAPGRHTSTLLQGVTFDVAAGRVLGVVGANGAGKTTLLRLLYRFHYPTTGSVKIGGRDIWSLSARDAAKCVAAVLQEQSSDFATDGQRDCRPWAYAASTWFWWKRRRTGSTDYRPGAVTA